MNDTEQEKQDRIRRAELLLERLFAKSTAQPWPAIAATYQRIKTQPGATLLEKFVSCESLHGISVDEDEGGKSVFWETKYFRLYLSDTGAVELLLKSGEKSGGNILHVVESAGKFGLMYPDEKEFLGWQYLYPSRYSERWQEDHAERCYWVYWVGVNFNILHELDSNAAFLGAYELGKRQAPNAF